MIEYIHTGNVTLQPRTLLGVMNAADYYGLEELKRACNGFIQQGCVTVDTVCALLGSAERYIQYKCTKSLVQKVLEFVDEHGEIKKSTSLVCNVLSWIVHVQKAFIFFGGALLFYFIFLSRL